MMETIAAPDHVVALRLAGKVTKGDYEAMIPIIEAKLEVHPKIGMFVDMSGVEKLTASAIMKDLAYSLSKIGDWKRFERAAVVADQDWIDTLISVGEKILPELDAQVFDPDDTDAALAWASPLAED